MRGTCSKKLHTIRGVMVFPCMLPACSGDGFHLDPPLVRETPAIPASHQATNHDQSENPSNSIQIPEGLRTIIWNDQVHYFITDDQGHRSEGLLDEHLTKPLGDPLALERTRVTVVGVLLSDAPTILQAQSIEREREE